MDWSVILRVRHDQLQDEEIHQYLLDSDINERDKATTVKNLIFFIDLLKKLIDRFKRESSKDAVYLERAEIALESERLNTATIQEEMRLDKIKIKKMVDERKTLEEDLKDTKMDLDKCKSRLLNRSDGDDSKRRAAAEKSEDMERLRDENVILKEEYLDGKVELEDITRELEAAVTEIERNEEELISLRNLFDLSDEKLQGLMDERDSLKIKVEDLNDQMVLKESSKDTDISMIEKKLKSYRKRLREAEGDIIERKEEIKGLKEDLHGLNGDETVNVRHEMTRKDALIVGLRLQLGDSKNDFERLAKDWNRFDLVSSKKEYDSVKVKEKISGLRERRADEKEKVKKLSKQLLEKEKCVYELQQKVSKFESGSYGMKDAIAEIKQSKIQLRVSDERIISLAAEVTSLEKLVGHMKETKEQSESKKYAKKEHCGKCEKLELKYVELSNQAEYNLFKASEELNAMSDNCHDLESRLERQKSLLVDGEKSLSDLNALKESNEALKKSIIATNLETQSRDSRALRKLTMTEAMLLETQRSLKSTPTTAVNQLFPEAIQPYTAEVVLKEDVEMLRYNAEYENALKEIKELKLEVRNVSLTRERDGKALKFAQQTTLSLQRQVGQKDGLIEKYLKIIKDHQLELEKKALDTSKYMDEMRLKLDEMTEREIGRAQFVEKVEESNNSYRELEKEVQLVEELKTSSGLKDITLNNNLVKIGELTHGYDNLLKSSETEIATLLTATNLLTVQLQEESERNTKLVVELEASKEIHLATHDVKRLRAEIRSKELKNVKLTGSLNSLRASLEKMAMELTECQLRERNLIARQPAS